MKNAAVRSPLKPIGRLFSRFHMTFFIVFIVAGLGFAVILINEIITESSTAENYTSPLGAGTIDQATLERIKELHTSADAPVPVFPEGRTNPFSE